MPLLGHAVACALERFHLDHQSPDAAVYSRGLKCIAAELIAVKGRDKVKRHRDWKGLASAWA